MDEPVMRKLALAFALLVGMVGAASAQCNGIFPAGTICGSVAGGIAGPVLTSSFPSGALTVGTSTIVGGTSTGILYNNAGVLGNYSTITAVNGGPLTINPTPASINQALSTTQTSPTGNSVTGPLSFNLLNITDSSQVTGSGSDSTGNSNSGTVGFRVNTLFTGNNLAGSGTLLSGLFSATVGPTTLNGDVVGLAGTAYTNTNFSGGAFLEGMNAVGQVGSSGSANIVVGLDANAGILVGGSATNRVGIDVGSFGAVQASGVDAAIAIIGISSTTPWKKVFAFSNFAGQPGVGTTTDMFWSDTSYTIANVFNLANMTVSGNILNFPNIAISGGGAAVFGSGVASLPALPTIISAKVASGGQANLLSSTNIVSGSDGLDTFVSTGAGVAELVAGVNEPNRTTTLFGVTMGSWGSVYTGAGNGLLLGTLQSAPLVIGTNNTEAARVLSTQVFKFAAASFTANGAVATAMSSVGPTGSHTTVQEWFTVQDSGGTVRYIPAF